MEIMVVDDEQDVELLFKQKFRRELKKGKVKLSFSFSAEEALEYIQGHKNENISLIIADINMPGINGLELLKIIKEQFANLKVFIITAYGDEYSYQIAMEYGADDYMNKPIEFEKLKEKILEL
ncbi:MAG: response regulator [Symploca sp. SIO2E9]|nr:response regulator [Symploca sp. SIO2E9]